MLRILSLNGKFPLLRRAAYDRCMCGIAGFWCSAAKSQADELRATAARMAATLKHRGPDDADAWVDAEAGVGFGFQRLAIIDLSPAGRQPMYSACGRYCIIYNGEIYNAANIRRELEALGHAFRGHSDTEVLLTAIAVWGVEQAVRKSIGMFAFAVWDKTQRKLTLVRDRMGIKPLYYGRMGDTFLFGSELKALRAYPAFRAEVDRGALGLYLQHNYVPAPHSIYRGIYKLPPGTMLTVEAGNFDRARPAAYWSLQQVAELGEQNSFRGSAEDAVGELDALLRDAVKLRMIADVPLGAFLSGGIDSTTVVALMQAQSARPVKTFTIGFSEDQYNEANYAKHVAAHLGTDHTEHYVTPQEALEVIPQLPAMYDEPFADSSQIPTYLVSKLARRDVTVSLSGDGGDELFAGYDRYFHFARMWERLGRIPRALKRPSAMALGTLARASRSTAIGPKLAWRAEYLTLSDPESLYARFNTHWRDPEKLIVGYEERTSTASDRSRWARLASFTHHMMFIDGATYLPDDILTKVDRASMAVSLEARVPLLDHRVVEFAWKLPVGLNVHAGRGKLLLRRVLDRYVPRDLVERPKVGFGVPIDAWLRGPLRDWADALLDERRLRDDGFFHPAPIRAKWKQHLSGKADWHYYLWDVLMFQAWLNTWRA